MLLLLITASVAIVIMCGCIYEWRGHRSDQARWPAPGRMVDIGNGTRLHLYETGLQQGPTVILEAGLCASSLNWRALQNELAPFVRVVSYDRAGLGWSDPAQGAPTPETLAIELMKMLEAAAINGPYILVGHSFGAFVIQSFTQLFPEAVTGVVLLDPLRAEHWWPLTKKNERLLRNGLRLTRRASTLARLGILRAAIALYRGGLRSVPRALNSAAAGKQTHALERVTEQVSKLPRELWDIIAAHWTDPQFFKTLIAYLEALPNNAFDMAHSAPIENVPVAIITGDKNEMVAPSSLRTIAPDANHIRAVRSGHWIHLDEPQLVAGVIRRYGGERTHRIGRCEAAPSRTCVA